MTTKTEREEARARLLEWVKPGDTLYTVLRHRSPSGMTRDIDVIQVSCKTDPPEIYMGWIGYNVAVATGRTYNRDNNGVRVVGAGMDMGFELIYTLSRVLFPDGFECVGERCPSNDHFNGDRDYTPHHHQDGGYALQQRWI